MNANLRQRSWLMSSLTRAGHAASRNASRRRTRLAHGSIELADDDAIELADAASTTPGSERTRLARTSPPTMHSRGTPSPTQPLGDVRRR